MVTDAVTTGRGSRTFVVLATLFLLYLALPHTADAGRRRAAAKHRKHHWRADVIKNHLMNHKSLEGMARLVDGQTEYEGTNERKTGTVC